MLRPSAYWQVFCRESLAFKFACIYLMFEYVRPQSIYTAIDFLPYGLLSLVGGFVVVLSSPVERSARVHGSKLLLLSVFFVHVLITIFFSRFPHAGVEQLSTLIGWILAYYLITKAVNTERRFVFFYVLFLLFSLKMSQHGFRSWLASGFAFNREGVTGAPGWFQNSGEVGIQMCIFLPMSLYFMLAGWNRWSTIQRAFVLLLPLTAIGTVVASSSRGAIIGSAAALLWMLSKSQYKVRGLVALSILAAVVLVALPSQFMSRFDTMGQDHTSQLRLEYWAFGWELMKQHPFLGVGYFNWYPTYAAHLLEIGNLRSPEVCHNIFIQAGSELGFTGLALEFALVASTFVLNARTRKALNGSNSNQTLFLLSLGLDGGMIGYLISAQFVTVLYYPYQWIALALTVALHNTAVRSGASSTSINSLRTGMAQRNRAPVLVNKTR